TRTKTAQENTLAAGRRNPAGAYGPNTCVNGYVWREAYNGDVVCVTPDRRTLAHNDNAQAASRVLRNSPAPAPKPAQCTYDGTSTTGTESGSNPTRYQALYSPALGARWNKCSHTVTVYFNGDNTNDHFNLLVNGKQRELAGARGAREYSMPDSQFGEGYSTFAIQSCQRGGMFAPSVCTNWSPTVKLPVHVGSISQG
ncbi:MAG TPA: hypothetical protein VL595_26995, partial [Pseudonocardia sp.]|nr:hypothetical protein [Pseudonocardia sp.]